MATDDTTRLWQFAMIADAQLRASEAALPEEGHGSISTATQLHTHTRNHGLKGKSDACFRTEHPTLV
ncbi:hypothetical protein E4U60_006039 [Claviceps pazoutovae]|uniref:Uncharacterized protein n=1 Tax=Claviceps pazoutovae TaxID=1649127 RepID=A0A9P7MHC8_9HYPO|nr:hypothetical protein E4U60_006039 [Claviceps pazoutovae]